MSFLKKCLEVFGIKNRIYLFLILLFGLVLRLLFIDFIPCSYDEMYNIIIARAEGIKSTIVASKTTNHPVLFFLILKFFNGVQEFELYRIFSILSWVVYVIFCIRICKFYKFSNRTICFAAFLLGISTELLVTSLMVKNYMIVNAFLAGSYFYFIKFLDNNKYKYVVFALTLFLFSSLISYTAIFFIIPMAVIYTFFHFKKLSLLYRFLLSSLVFIFSLLVVFMIHNPDFHLEENVYNLKYLRDGFPLEQGYYEFSKNLFIRSSVVLGPLKEFPLLGFFIVAFCLLLLFCKSIKLSKETINIILTKASNVFSDLHFKILLSFFIIMFVLNFMLSLFNVYPLFASLRHQLHIFFPLYLIIFYIVNKVSIKRFVVFLVVVLITSCANIYIEYQNPHSFIKEKDFDRGEEITEYFDEKLTRRTTYFVDFMSLIRLSYQVKNFSKYGIIVEDVPGIEELIKVILWEPRRLRKSILYVDLWYHRKGTKKIFTDSTFNAGDRIRIMTYRPKESKIITNKLRVGKNLYKITKRRNPYQDTEYLELTAEKIARN